MSPDFKDQRGFYLFLIIVPSSVMFEELLQMHDSARETRRQRSTIAIFFKCWSCLEAHPGFFRLLMKGKFDAYVV